MSSLPQCVLVVGESSAVHEGVERAARECGCRTVVAGAEAVALSMLDAEAVDVVVLAAGAALDGALPTVTKIVERWPGLPVVVLAPASASDSFAEALEAGAFDLLPQTASADEIAHSLAKAIACVDRGRALPPPPPTSEPLLFGKAPVMREVRDLLERAATSRATVLIRGESGTGKELAARTVHQRSDRRDRPFVKIDCASLPETLLESELFGYEKGAFTGATARKLGRVELANGGTLFLDEVGELTEPIQAKLLRLLQDREIQRLGATAQTKVDVRVVTATHRDLETMVVRREFRQDLFYRLNVVPIWLPPLRARRDDIELLAKHFCETTARENGKDITLSAEALRVLRRQRWPGNVRQLQNFVERLVVLSTASLIGATEVTAELSREVTFSTEPASTAGEAGSELDPAQTPVLPLNEEVRRAEKRALERALARTGGNRSRAARLLGVSRSNFYSKLEEHGLLKSPGST